MANDADDKKDAAARANELEFLLKLNREADHFLSDCEGNGTALDESVQAFLDRMVPRAGAIAGVARITPSGKSTLVQWNGLNEATARNLLRGAAPELEGVVARHPLAVGKIRLGELVLLFPDTLADKANARTEILAEELDGAVLTLAEVERELVLKERLRALEKPTRGPNDTTFGRYTLLRLLGTGGMAQVHLARVDGPGGVSRLTALKRMLPHLAKDGHLTAMFLDEARVASLVNHPNVCKVEDFGELSGTYYMAMEFLAGVDGANLVDSTVDKGGIPVSYAVAVASQIAMGLHAAHELKDLDGKPLNLVHRDVSPQNVLMTFDGIAKLVDFGVAKSQVQRERTRETAVKGKLCYMSPEQCLARAIDRRSDVFALGAVLYEMLSGRPLFLRENDGATLRALLDDPVPKITKYRKEVGEELWRIILRSLARNPEERYPTALHLSCALDGYLKALGGTPSPSEMGRWLHDMFPLRAEEIAAWVGNVHRIPTQVLDDPEPSSD
jgi:serine/threonine-protein kinase